MALWAHDYGKDFTNGQSTTLAAAATTLPREPFLANPSATSFAVAIDRHGKLNWSENQIGGDHLIAVLTEKVSDAYLHFLREKSISYLFAGYTEIDFSSALSQLADLFSVKTLMLEGGGHINGALLSEGLIDEISLLILPLADGSPGTPTSFETLPGYVSTSSDLALIEIRKLELDVLWLRYRVQKN